MLGAQLKQDYNKVQEEWLEDPDHLQQWEAQTISAGDQRILITLWLAEAAKRFRNRGLAACISSWERTGCGMSADGSERRTHRSVRHPELHFCRTCWR